MDEDVGLITDDPSWLPHRYDPQRDTFHFRRVTRANHRRATFLIEEYLEDKAEPLVIERARVAHALADRPVQPLHFLFHSAFCCSTLLARALDVDGVATALKEPVILNDLVGWRRRGAAADRLAAVTRDALALLARPFLPGEAVVVKPSNIANVLAPAILATRPDVRAVLMTAPLGTFLASIARKGLEGRLWTRGLFAGLMGDGIASFGYDAAALFGQTDLQIAALGWLAQQRMFQALLSGPMSKRLRSLRSDALLADPAGTIARLDALFGLALPPGKAADIASGPAFGRHSKTGVGFDAGDRHAEYAAAEGAHAEEITKIATWAREVARSAGLALDLPAAL